MPEITIRLGKKDLEDLFVDKTGNINIEIGQQIADAFSKRYFKGVISNEVIKACENDVRVHTREAYAEYIGTLKQMMASGETAAPMLKTAVRERVKKDVDALIRETIREEVSLRMRDIQKMVDDVTLEETIKLVKDSICKALGG